jgi:hypothetical protein
MRTLVSLRVGDRVRINHSAKPNYRHGRAATVSGWAGQNIVVSSTNRLAALSPASWAAHHSSSSHWQLNRYPKLTGQAARCGGGILRCGVRLERWAG